MGDSPLSVAIGCSYPSGNDVSLSPLSTADAGSRGETPAGRRAEEAPPPADPRRPEDGRGAGPEAAGTRGTLCVHLG